MRAQPGTGLCGQERVEQDRIGSPWQQVDEAEHGN
jgi:hypothetical protein